MAVNSITVIGKNYAHQHAMMSWCEQTIGIGQLGHQSIVDTQGIWQGTGRWNCYVKMGGATVFEFREEKYQEWFLMRWSDDHS